jgi:16S rRNA processing protein RimM
MFVVMAEVVRAVGLRGEIKLSLSGDFDETVLNSRFARLRGVGGELTEIRLERSRWKGATLVVKFEHIEGRAAAEATVGCSVGFREEDYDDPEFPRPSEPMPFVYDGLRVESTEGVFIGTVSEVLVLPASLVLRVRDGERESLIPVIPPVMRELDRQGGVVRIHLLEGLLDQDVEPS